MMMMTTFGASIPVAFHDDDEGSNMMMMMMMTMTELYACGTITFL